MSEKRKSVTIYTDGACRGNPGPGGYAAILTSGAHERVLMGAHPHTTNNQMELMAVIAALEALTDPCAVRLHSDSQYVLKGIREWINGWKRRGWKTANGKPVKNQAYWRRLDAAAQREVNGGALDIEWIWVRGHSGDPGNERADQLANDAIDAMRAGTAEPVALPAND